MDELVAQVGPYVAFLIVLVIVGLGVFLIRGYTKSKKKAKESLSWPSVTGIVTVSQVEKSVSSDEDGTSYTYSPHIEYAYNVNGNNYVSKQVMFGGYSTTGTTKKPQLAVNKYPLNTPVRVFYNPSNPKEAVLETTAGSGAKGILIGGVVLTIIGLAMAVVLLVELLG